FFFFQAEDGIRDLIVTGVQTCALPISFSDFAAALEPPAGGHLARADGHRLGVCLVRCVCTTPRCRDGDLPGGVQASATPAAGLRSEERRVGKEWRCGVGAGRDSKNESG